MDKPNDDALTVSVPEAGRRLGLSKDAAYRAAHRGKIPTIKLGALYRVPKVQLEKLLRGDK